jgi:hypothetical protein
MLMAEQLVLVTRLAVEILNKMELVILYGVLVGLVQLKVDIGAVRGLVLNGKAS